MKNYFTGIRSTLLWISLFSIAMGYLESSVVVYLREILYPAGFAFPLAPISSRLAVTEICREAATLVMLVGAGILTGRTRTEKFAFFLYSFALWDIFYYVFLKLLLNWPDSFFTWDILFLIPLTWTGPVLAPLISSFTMIILALAIINFTDREADERLSAREWSILVAGALVVWMAYIWDYSAFILRHYGVGELWSLKTSQALYDLSMKYIPVAFPWKVFILGEILLLVAIFLYGSRLRSESKKHSIPIE